MRERGTGHAHQTALQVLFTHVLLHALRQPMARFASQTSRLHGYELPAACLWVVCPACRLPWLHWRAAAPMRVHGTLRLVWSRKRAWLQDRARAPILAMRCSAAVQVVVVLAVIWHVWRDVLAAAHRPLLCFAGRRTLPSRTWRSARQEGC